MHTIPHIRASYDEVEILDCLADNQASFSQFDHHQTTTFYVGEDFYLVIYIASADEPIRFRMYVVPDFSINIDAMIMMSHALENQARNGYYPQLMRAAKGKVLDTLTMADTFRAYYGK